METKEMTAEELRNKYEEMKANRDYWMDRTYNLEKKLKSLIEILKNITEIIEK